MAYKTDLQNITNIENESHHEDVFIAPLQCQLASFNADIAKQAYTKIPAEIRTVSIFAIA